MRHVDDAATKLSMFATVLIVFVAIRERIFIELMTPDRKLKASREGLK